MFAIGDVVQCINDDEPPQSAPPFVVKGRTYTVAKVAMAWWPVGQYGPVTIMQPMDMVWVVGLPSETGHFAFRFEKVQKKTKDTDISVFKEILRTAKVPEKTQ